MTPKWLWLSFIIFILLMIAVDMITLGHRRAQKVSVKKALGFTALWIVLALVFNALFWWYLQNHYGVAIANQKALEFFTGYLLEKSLSADNIFVFLFIFNFFSVPSQYQHRVLLYGVLGAIVLRGIMIITGVWLINQFAWLFYVFGIFIIFTAIRLIFFAKDKLNLAENPIIKFLRHHLKITDQFHRDRFFVRLNNVVYFTPLFLVLVVIEISDIIFAFDSIPAIFAITRDPFIIFTSNIFAILGLRAIYFVLVDFAQRLAYLNFGLGVILLFIGTKMLISHWIKIPTLWSLAIIVTILAITVVLSFRARRGNSR